MVDLEIKEKNPNIIMLTPYNGANEKATFRCLVDGYEWVTTPHSLLRHNGLGCPRCSKKERYTHEQISEKIHDVQPNIRMLEKYHGINTSVLMECVKCGYQWKTAPSSIIHSKSGCPKCVGVARKTNEKFVEELYEKDPTIIPLTKYKQNKEKIECKCSVCGIIWEASPNALLRKNATGCPRCRSSKGERKIANHLDVLGIDFIQQKSFPDLKATHSLLFDFYLPTQNMCIEYDGQQHFYPVKFAGLKDKKAEERFAVTQKRDAIKTQYCKDKGIELIRIPYTDFDNVENILDKHLL